MSEQPNRKMIPYDTANAIEDAVFVVREDSVKLDLYCGILKLLGCTV